MQSWESVWNMMIKSEKTKEEYKKAFLLNMFQKIVSKMNMETEYRNHVLQLYRQTSNPKEMTRTIFSKEFDYQFDDSEIHLLGLWMNAYRRKQPNRKSFSHSFKKELCENQNNRCAICCQLFNENHSHIHIDHIIPWALVGDELEDNYQALCETCNECKSSKTDYVFRNLLKLT